MCIHSLEIRERDHGVSVKPRLRRTQESHETETPAKTSEETPVVRKDYDLGCARVQAFRV